MSIIKQMQEVDYIRILRDRLITIFIDYQYRLEHPIPLPNETRALKEMHYSSNNMFHARVNNLTAGVLHVVNHTLEDIDAQLIMLQESQPGD